MSYTTSFEGMGEDGLPDYVYYNCDIINNRTSDLNQSGLASPDPQIRFNETRDAPIVKDSSKYHFSIVRFTMNGANRDLPMFIPNIQTGQPDPDLTTYKVAIAYQQRWSLADGTTYVATIVPTPTTIRYSTEWTNQTLAPVPTSPLTQQDLSSRYYWVTTYNQALTWFNAGLVSAHDSGTTEGTYTKFKAQWLADNGSLAEFPYPTFTSFQNDVNTPQITFSSSTKRFSVFGDSDGFGQRITPFSPVVNPYIFDVLATYPNLAYVYSGGSWYQNTSGGNLTGVVPPGVGWTAVVGDPPDYTTPATPNTPPQMRLFFNTNMYGLFANFPVEYYNRVDLTGFNIPNPLNPTGFYTAPAGYTYELLFINKFYQNLIDFRLSPYAGTPPLGLVPITNQAVYYQMEQDYQSIDSIWSPIGSIVFTTTLVPIKTELTGQPLILGESNIGESTATTQNAFQPIITDIALDQQLDGADDYRQFIYYAPTAEYRLSDFTSSKQEIRNVDVQVFWKNRLDSQLIPINMFNLSSVSIKMMFRHKRVSR